MDGLSIKLSQQVHELSLISIFQKYPDMLPQKVQDFRLWQERNSTPGAPATAPPPSPPNPPPPSPEDISSTLVAPPPPALVDHPSACKKSKKARKVKYPLDPKKPATVFFLFFHSLKAEVQVHLFSLDVNHIFQPGDGRQARDVLQGGDGRVGEGLEQLQRQRKVSVSGETQATDG